MIDLEERREETKNAINSEVDRFYEEFEKGSADPEFKIGDFERTVLEHKRRLDEILRDAAGKALSDIDAEHKKIALSAEEQYE